MTTTTVRLLQAASDIVGGDAALAGQLGVTDSLLARFMADRHELPDPLLLRAVDIILADRQSGFSLTGPGLPELSPGPQNDGRGSDAAATRAGPS